MRRVPSTRRFVDVGGVAGERSDRGETLDYDSMNTDPEFWNKVQEQVVDHDKPENWLFDTVIVDEGQDFQPIWYDILESFMSDGADILWLQDPEQNLRMQAPVQLPPSFVGYRCITNYRSPTSIARFIRRNLEVEFECGNDLPGLGVGLWQYDEPEEQ